MSLHRHNPRRDANEPALVAYLAAHGICWHPVSMPGGPDGLATKWHRVALAEVKSANGTLTKAQIRFRQTWTGPVIWELRTEADCDRLVRWFAEGLR